MRLRHVDTPSLRIGFLEDGPESGPPVVLLHGFPDDATSYTEVMQALAARGHRTLAPFQRGCGPTTFQADGDPRAADMAALGQDAIDFIDALGIESATLVGQDWGSPAAEVVAIARPQLVTKLVKLNWYGVYTAAVLAESKTFSYPQLRTLWYVWMLNLPLGKMVVENDVTGFARTLWEEWSPSWDRASRTAFERASQSFANPDYARVALNAYRAHLTDGALDPRHDDLRKRLEKPPSLTCPVVVLRGADDGVERTPLTKEAIARYFKGPFQQHELPGVGHFPQREAPGKVVDVVVAGAA